MNTIFQADALNNLELQCVEAEQVIHDGKTAVRLVEGGARDAHSMAIISESHFTNGTIEALIAGNRLKSAPPDMRGFVGIAFRVQSDTSQFECFYLRPTNGRANDQLRRNHSTQYISHPDYPWYRLREENPGVYESYTDLVAGAWTKIKIVVQGTQAQLYVNGADQPCLIVNDLKLGESSGKIALWLAMGTEAHFAELAVHPD